LNALVVGFAFLHAVSVNIGGLPFGQEPNPLFGGKSTSGFSTYPLTYPHTLPVASGRQRTLAEPMRL